MSQTIRAEVLAELEAVAEAHNLSIDELLEQWLADYRVTQATAPDSEQYPAGTLGRLVAAARRMPAYPPPDGITDIAEHADDILRAEFADHLWHL